NPVTASLARGFGGAEGYYRSGRQKYLEGLLFDARIYFKAGLEKFKESDLVPDFHYWLGEIDFHQENYQDASSHFAIVAKSPENRFYHFSCYSLAWLEYREKSFAAATKWFVLAAESLERRLASAALFWQSEALFQIQKPDLGRSILIQLTSEYPKSVECRAALYRLATISFNQRDYRAALNYLTAMPAALVDSDMLQRQADLARGWCCYFLGEYIDAENVFKRLLSDQAGRNDVVPLAFLGVVLAQLQQTKLYEAHDTFTQRHEKLRRAPVAAAALRELAAAFFVAEELELSVRLSEELITAFSVELLQVDDFRRLARLQVILDEKPKALQTLDSGIDVFTAQGQAGEVTLVLRLEQAQVLYSADEFAKTLVLLEGLFVEKWMLKSSVDRAQVYLLLARASNQSGNYSRTLTVLAEFPSDFVPITRAELLYERGWAALQSGDFKLAVNDFSTYLEIAQESGASTLLVQNAVINQAEALFNLHQDRETAELLHRFIARWPQSSFLPRVRNYQGLLALRRGGFELAEAIFADLVSSVSAWDKNLEDEVLYNLGESLFSLEKYSEAITVYEELVAKNLHLKLSGRALIRIGESYFNQGKYLKSQLVYLKAKQLWPGGEIDEKASYGMLLLAYNQDKFSYLEVEVKSFIHRFPDSSYTVPLMLLLTDLYQRQGREVDLITLLRELETGTYADDLKLEAFFRHFKLDLENGRREAAQWDCQRLLERFPLSKYECDCRLYLSREDFLARDFKTALETLEGGASFSCPDPDIKRKVTLLKARIYQQLGDYVQARKLYLEVAESGQGRDTLAFQAFAGLGDVFLHEKEYDEALFFYDKAMKNP
ncbi:tetratricopeptide repeat protein, partial [bacterium]|nr:tetratricopeptide repeat protein [bacterium]